MDQETPSADDSTQGRVLATMGRILRPLIKMALAHGVKYQQMDELLKTTFINTARENPDTANISRISVATGIHRKDVNRLLGSGEDAVTQSHSLESEVFTRWATDPALRGPDGKPLVLPRVAREPGQLAFEAVVRQITTDVHPRSILDSMIRLGLASEDVVGRVTLRNDAFVPQPERERMLAYMADSGHDHMAASVANVLGKDVPFLEQSVFADELSEDSIGYLHTVARGEWQRLLSLFARDAAARCAADEGKPDANRRFRVGMYFFAEPAKSAPRTPEK